MNIRRRSKNETELPFYLSMCIWIIPLGMYSMLKSFHLISKNEWLWWLVIPMFIIGWFLMNFKIEK
jgi:hypothetical protein